MLARRLCAGWIAPGRAVAVRDTKTRGGGPDLVFAPEAWRSFITGVKQSGHTALRPPGGGATEFRWGHGKWYKGGVDQLRVSVSGGYLYIVVALAGESDVYTYDQLRGALEAEAAKGIALLVVDLAGLEFMDSTGVQVLLDIRVLMNGHGGKLVLARPQNTAARVLNLVGADQLIPVFGSVEEAIGTPLS